MVRRWRGESRPGGRNVLVTCGSWAGIAQKKKNTQPKVLKIKPSLQPPEHPNL